MVNAVILYNIYSSTQVIGGIQDPIRWPSITHCNVALAIFFNLPSVEATTAENSKIKAHLHLFHLGFTIVYKLNHCKPQT